MFCLKALRTSNYTHEKNDPKQKMEQGYFDIVKVPIIWIFSNSDVPQVCQNLKFCTVLSKIKKQVLVVICQQNLCFLNAETNLQKMQFFTWIKCSMN